MRVLFDATTIRMSRLFSSIPQYIFRLLDALDREERKHVTILVDPSALKYMKKRYSEFSFLSFKGYGYKILLWRNPLYYFSCYKYRKIIKRNKFDIVFDPTDIPVYNVGKLPCKKVVVCHDLKEIKDHATSLREAIRKWDRTRLYQKSFETADAIIAISRYTKQEICRLYPSVENKIHVVYNSVVVSHTSKKPCEIPQKYILYVNTLQPYKNVITLVKAFCSIINECDYDLLIVGTSTPYWEETVVPLINENGAGKRIVRVENLANEELRYVYEHASLFVTPSLYEGFGYTPIEAAICGCPVVSSIQESLPDVTMGLASYYYPAMDDAELAKVILNKLRNPISQGERNMISNVYSSRYSSEMQKKGIEEILKIIKQNKKI